MFTKPAIAKIAPTNQAARNGKETAFIVVSPVSIRTEIRSQAGA
jgi:hypothetical protein